MESLRIHTFGGLRIERGKEIVTGFETRKTEALIVYLICNQRPRLREVMADLLWDARSLAQASSNLRVVLTSLRKRLKPYFTITREYVALNPDAEVWSDVGEFETLLNAIHEAGGIFTAQDAERAEQAVNLYHGEFLQGFYVRESQGFEEWLTRERERLHRMTVGTFHDLVAYDLQTGAYQRGIDRTTRLLALDPFDESSHRQMMQLLAHSGLRSEAMAQYETCRQLLWDELGVEPSAATKSLYDNIRSGEMARITSPLRSIRGYELEEEIGLGNYGAVYRAFQPGVGREVAIKVILPKYANDAEFIRRFEVEAQTIARLEHPHIVPLYDYWREPDGAYLVMRLLKGGNLEALLQSGPLQVGQVVELVDQVAAGLALAHQHGVVHRDLKPANILLDEAGNSYLTDFGIAKVLGGNGWKTQTGGLFGTPAYLSPEQIRNEPVTPQTDIYSFGIILYQALTREVPFSDLSLSDLIEMHLYHPFPSVRDLRPDLPEEVDQVIQQATSKDPHDRYPDALTLSAAFRQAASGLPVPPLDAAIRSKEMGVEFTNPYKGLTAFQEADAEDFFGREALIERLLARLGGGEQSARFLALVGPSGCGKSSLVKAGLIPALREGRIVASEKWFILEMLPGTHPIEELEAALLRVAVNPPASLRSQLQEDRRGLVRSVKRVLPGEEDAELLLVIDQFEEIFTLVKNSEEAHFFMDSLVAAADDPRGRVRVVITLRADFYDRPLMFPDFSVLVQEGTEVVVPLTTEELVRTIQEPAARVGIHFEEGLIPQIVAEVNEQPGALPLLQYSLTELFEQRYGSLLTRAAYERIGGVLAALNQRAEAVYQGLSESEQAAARQVFLRLITLGEGVEDTRRRVLKSELKSLEGLRDRENGSIEAVLDAFGKARLLSFDRDLQTRGPTVEVAHEALLREWSRLCQWLDESRADLRMQRVVARAAAEWKHAGQEASFLLRGTRLDQFVDWAAETTLALTGEEYSLLDSSLADRAERRTIEAARQEREAALELRSRRFLRGLVGVFAVAASVAVLLSLFAFKQQNLAGQNAATAEAARAEAVELADLRSRDAQVSQSLALAAQSGLALQAGNLDLALALAWEANRIPDPPGRAQMALSEAAYAPGTIRLFAGHAAPVWSVAVSPDGRYGLSGDADGVIYLWDLETGETLRRLEGHKGLVSSLAFAPDGRQALSGSHDQTVLYWDLESGQIIHHLEGHQAMVNSVAISPDGRTAASSSGRNFSTEPFSSADNSVRLWDLQSGEELQRFDFFTDGITAVAFTPNGQQIAVGTVSDGLILVDIATGKALVRPERGYKHNMAKVVISPDGHTVLTANDYTVNTWNLQTGEVSILGQNPTSRIHGLALSPDGKRVLSGAVVVIEWDLETGEQINKFSIDTLAVAYRPDGSTAIIGSTDGTLRLLALESGAEIERLPPSIDRIRGAAYSLDGRSVIIDDTGTLYSWELETGESIWRTMLAAIGELVFGDLVLSPDGKQILVSEIFGSLSLWDAATGEFLRRLPGDPGFGGHTENASVYMPAFDPSGKFAISGAADVGAKLIYWDLETGKPLQQFETDDGVLGTAISREGRTALSAEETGKVNWWDLETGELIRSLEGHTNQAWSVAYIDDKTAISASDDGTMILWDLESGAALRSFLGHASGIKRVALSPDKRLALSASRDGTAILWDVQAGEPLRRYAGHGDELMSVAWRPDGVEALTGGSDGQAIRWRIDADLVSFLDWVAQNRYLRPLSCAERETFQVEPLCPEGAVTEEKGAASQPVQMSGAALLPPLPAPEPLTAAPEPESRPAELSGAAARGINFGAILPGGGQAWEYAGSAGERLSIRVAAENPANTIWWADRQLEAGLLDPTLSLYAPDGSLLARADDLENGVATDAYLDSIELPQTGVYRIEVRSYRGQTGGGYRLILADPRRVVFKAGLPTTIGLAIHPDSRTALVGVGRESWTAETTFSDNRIWVWDLATGEVTHRLEGHGNTPLAIAISPDGKRALSADEGGQAILWDLETWEEVRRFDNAGSTIMGILFLPDGQTALTASGDEFLSMWNLASGERTRLGDGHGDWVMDLALSPDGQTAYSLSWLNEIRVWDLASREVVATYHPFVTDTTRCLAVSPDGSQLLVGPGQFDLSGNEIQGAVLALLDSRTGETLVNLEGHTAEAVSVVFSPDGRQALSGSFDQTVRLWDVNTGEQLAMFTGHTAAIWKVAFSPDGLTGYSTSYDGSLRVWDLREFVGGGS